MTILKLTDICKDYLQGKQTVRVLKNINLTVEQEYLDRLLFLFCHSKWRGRNRKSCHRDDC